MLRRLDGVAMKEDEMGVYLYISVYNREEIYLASPSLGLFRASSIIKFLLFGDDKSVFIVCTSI